MRALLFGLLLLLAPSVVSAQPTLWPGGDIILATSGPIRDYSLKPELRLVLDEFSAIKVFYKGETLTIDPALVFAVFQEKIALTTAETKPSNAEYRIDNLDIHPDNPATSLVDEGFLRIVLNGQNAEVVTCIYSRDTSPTGTFLNNALNKANLSTVYVGNATTGSLKQRIFHRLVVMGESTVICGKTLTGTLVGAVP